MPSMRHGLYVGEILRYLTFGGAGGANSERKGNHPHQNPSCRAHRPKTTAVDVYGLGLRVTYSGLKGYRTGVA